MRFRGREEEEGKRGYEEEEAMLYAREGEGGKGKGRKGSSRGRKKKLFFVRAQASQGEEGS